MAPRPEYWSDSILYHVMPRPFPKYRAFQDAAFEAILMGRGPLAQILGIGGGDGGLIGSLMGIFMPNATGGGAIPQNADGGMFYAPGSSRSDSGLSWLSSGEFIVNAAATTRNRALLETVNAGGDARAFASAPAAVHGRGSDGVVVQIINQTSSPIVEQSAEDRAPDGRRRVRFTLSEAVGDAISLPGGKARKTLATGFNLAPVGTAR